MSESENKDSQPHPTAVNDQENQDQPSEISEGSQEKPEAKSETTLDETPQPRKQDPEEVKDEGAKEETEQSTEVFPEEVTQPTELEQDSNKSSDQEKAPNEVRSESKQDAEENQEAPQEKVNQPPETTVPKVATVPTVQTSLEKSVEEALPAKQPETTSTESREKISAQPTQDTPTENTHTSAQESQKKQDSSNSETETKQEQGTDRPRARRAKRTQRMSVQSANANSEAALPKSAEDGANNAKQSAASTATTTRKVTAITTTTTSSSGELPPGAAALLQSNQTSSSEEAQDAGPSEPSVISVALGRLLCLVRCALKALWHIVTGLLKGGSVSRMLLGIVLYCSTLYIVGTYFVGRASENDLPDYAAVCKYMLRSAAFYLDPTILAFLAVRFSGQVKHHQFLYECIVDNVLLAANLMVLSTHVYAERIHWVFAIVIVSKGFRYLYWFSLFHLSHFWQTVFSAPTVFNHVAMFARNISHIAHHDHGVSCSGLKALLWWPVAWWGATVEAGDSEDDSSTSTQDEGTQAASPAYHSDSYRASMCNLVEKVFCSVDQPGA